MCEVIEAQWMSRLIHQVVSLVRMLPTSDRFGVGVKRLERSSAESEVVLVVLFILNPESEKENRSALHVQSGTKISARNS